MKGYLLLYNTSKRKEITKINHELFGRIITIPKKSKTFRYYYPGHFENVLHVKLTNGCYFTTEKKDDVEGLVKYIDAELNLPTKVLINSRNKWKEYAITKGIQVKNLTKNVQT